MLQVGQSVTMVNRALPDDPGVQVKVIDADATTMRVTTVFTEAPRQYVFTRRINGFWVERGFPTAVTWGRSLLLHSAVAR